MDEEIAELLERHGLPALPHAIEMIEDYIDIARSLAGENDYNPLEPLARNKRRAQVLENATTRVLKDAAEFALANDSDLDIVRLLKAKAQLAQLLPTPGGDEAKPWLAATAENFFEIWRSLPNPSNALYDGSKANAFVTECCQFVDNDVTESAVARAMKQRDPRSDEEREEAYAAWSDSDIAKLYLEIHRLEKRLATR